MEILVDETADRLFIPRYSPLGFLPLWDARGIVPCKGTGQATYPEEYVINDDENPDKRYPHYSRAGYERLRGELDCIT